MKRTLIRYKVKPEHADRNRELIKAVYAGLAATKPAGMRYATFQLDDGVSFVHIHSSEADGENVLGELPAFQAFLQGIDDRRDEPAALAELHEIGSYRFFDSE